MALRTGTKQSIARPKDISSIAAHLKPGSKLSWRLQNLGQAACPESAITRNIEI
jgi:hypothetical protein